MTDEPTQPDDAYDTEAYDIDPIEGYCMSCRESVEIENPRAVWTRKGQPATRGECPICGGTVFRMGKTELHDEANRPNPVEIGHEGTKQTAPKLSRDTVYVNYAAQDEAFAQKLAADLERSGIETWLHEESQTDVNWSSGVHPALTECDNMVFVLSAAALQADDVQQAWHYFKEQRKQIVIAQIDDTVTPPDAIRRSPRYDFDADYKRSLRQMVYEIGQ